MIKTLLKGKNPQAQIQLDILFNSIQENPNILWYPSAGNDYRDILELTPQRANLHKILELPDLFIHTDKNPDWLKLYGIVFSDHRTTVKIDNKYELQLTQEINYIVNPKYAYFSSKAPSEPTIYLLDILITSDVFGLIKKQLIYFIFENINFLNHVILKHKISITHIVKVREGCGFGGNRQSISIAYVFLSAMKTRYLIIDREKHSDFDIIYKLKSKHDLTLLDYDLQKLDSIVDWSGFEVNIFKITYRQQELKSLNFHQILDYVTEKRVIYF